MSAHTNCGSCVWPCWSGPMRGDLGRTSPPGRMIPASARCPFRGMEGGYAPRSGRHTRRAWRSGRGSESDVPSRAVQPFPGGSCAGRRRPYHASQQRRLRYCRAYARSCPSAPAGRCSLRGVPALRELAGPASARLSSCRPIKLRGGGQVAADARATSRGRAPARSLNRVISLDRRQRGYAAWDRAGFDSCDTAVARRANVAYDSAARSSRSSAAI